VDVGVVVDVVVDTTGHPLATDISHFSLGRPLDTSGASCLQSVGRVQVHDHVHVHDHVRRVCPTPSQVLRPQFSTRRDRPQAEDH
jgi:hypothetical protein